MIAVLGAVVLIALINGLLPSSSGPSSSSYATSAGGLAGWAALLTRSGHPVARLRATPADARLDPSETLVVLDPEVIVPADVSAMRTFVADGGRLIAGGPEPGAWLSELLGDSPTWTGHSPASFTPLLPLEETRGVGSVQSDGAGAWSDAGATVPVLGDPGSSLATVASIGRGRLVLLADSSPLQNHLLAQADNAAFALALAGESGRAVTFDEGVHGYGHRSGLGALPTRWKWALIGLVLAALVLVAARIRRLGPVQPPAPPALPPRRAHVEALAAALARTAQPAAATEPVRRHARELVLRRTGLPPDAGADEFSLAAARLGLDPDETRAIDGADDDVLLAGHALAKLSGTAVRR